MENIHIGFRVAQRYIFSCMPLFFLYRKMEQAVYSLPGTRNKGNAKIFTRCSVTKINL